MLSFVTLGAGLWVLPRALKCHCPQCPPELWAGPLARGVREGLAAQQRAGSGGRLDDPPGPGMKAEVAPPGSRFTLGTGRKAAGCGDGPGSRGILSRTLDSPQAPPSAKGWGPLAGVSRRPCEELACSPCALCCPYGTRGRAEWYCVWGSLPFAPGSEQEAPPHGLPERGSLVAFHR